ncbi:ABC transporter permease [Streptomyces chartreusis]|uniref:ABC transporter permease n=1 Tax=Streptomyces chartreusis TaxID=1969 RepID=UPI00369C9952
MIVALLGLVQVLASAEVGGPGTVPSPLSVLRALVSEVPTPELGLAVWETVYAWMIGLALSAVIGIAAGVLVGNSDLAYRATKGTFDFLRAVPPIALIPLAVLILGVANELKIVLVVWVCTWPVLLQTMSGVHDVEPLARDAARTMHLTRRQELRFVVIPTALPYIGTGLRIAAVMALLVCIGVELLAGAAGIGQYIFFHQASGNIPEMWATIIVAAVLGITVSQIFGMIERRITRWHPGNRD